MSDPTTWTRLLQPSQAPCLSLAEAEALLNEGRMPLRFRIHRELQRGLINQVFLAEDLELRRQVVVKFSDGLDADEVPPSCEHAHVPPIYDSGLAGGLRWTLQRYLPGRSLGQIMRDDPTSLSLPQRIRIIQSIAETLAAAHDRGLVHLDVKPDNILLGAHGDCALIDWDAASHVDSGRHPALQGTPAYMPPEQAHGQACDARCDIYALGATLQQLCIGQPPNRTPADQRWPRGRRWRALRAMCQRATHAEPAQRYDSMAVFAADCSRWIDDEAVSVLPESWWSLGYRRLRRQPALLGALVITVLAVLVLALVLQHQWQLQERRWHSLLQEDFSRPLDASRWQSLLLPSWDLESLTIRPLQGPLAPWLVDEGQLQARLDPEWSGCANLAYTALSDTDIRMRWTVTPLVTFANLNVIFGRHRQQLYTLHIASWGDPSLIGLTDSELRPVVLHRLPEAITSGRRYHMELRYHSGAIQLAIDGVEVLRYQPPPGREPRYLNAIGFEAAGNQLLIDDLHIERLALPQLIDQESLADLLETRGDYASALLLLKSLPMSRSTILARARCLRGLQQPDAAIALLRAQVHLPDPGQQVRLVLADMLLDQGATREGLQVLEQLTPPLADPLFALGLIDRVLEQRCRQAIDLHRRQSIRPAAESFVESWHTWLQRWQLDLSSWEVQQVPSGLRELTAFLHDALHGAEPVPLLQSWLPPLRVPEQGPSQVPVADNRIVSHTPLPVAANLPAETRRHAAFVADMRRDQPGLRVHTRPWDPLRLRQAVNLALLHAVQAADAHAIETALTACADAVRLQGFEFGELLYPACVLAAAQRPDEARTWLQRCLDGYPDAQQRAWRPHVMAILNGALPPPFLTDADEMTKQQRERSLLQALRADLDGRRQDAASHYHYLHSTMLDWQVFFDWRLADAP